MSQKRYKIDQISVSELGFLMFRLYIKEEKRWTTVNLGKWEEVLAEAIKEANIKIEDIDNR